MVGPGRHIDAITDAIENNNGFIGLNLLIDENTGDDSELTESMIYKTGVVAKIFKKLNLPDNGVNILINSIRRYRIVRFESLAPIVRVEPMYIPEVSNVKTDEDALEMKAFTRALIAEVKEVSEDNPLFTEEMRLTMVNVDEPGKLADFITSMLNVERAKQQDVLEMLDVKERMLIVLDLVRKEKEIVKLQHKIQGKINETVQKQQRDYFLKEQLKEIQKELGIATDEKSKTLERFKKALAELTVGEEVKEKITQEIEKYEMTDSHSPEFSLTRSYLDTVLTLPWNTESVEAIDLKKAKKLLDQDHYGLTDVKERILEFLAVRKLKPGTKGSIICLVGPPGVGKTSMGKSIAGSLNRKFFRFSLGGMRDEAEIKGHRRTYIGAMPGKIMQALKIVKTKNPVIMLDEIDKLGSSYQGDPSSALLEVLDPEQNVAFRDHYIDMPFDLSNVLFITTANTIDTIPRPLLDRMEVIRLSGYILEEKMKIAEKYIIPRQLERHGLSTKNLSFDNNALSRIISGYAKEAGLRNFERNIEKVCRKVATEVATKGSGVSVRIDLKNVETYLGKEIFNDDLTSKVAAPGIVIGLAWTELGGSTLTIECIMAPSKKQQGNINLTGRMGEVMVESAKIAYSYVRSIATSYKVSEEFFEDNMLHLHIPAGATPKDGPSAGITMATAMFSLATGKKVRDDIAMTGELSLTGKVLPIGGLKEKVIAAKRTNFIRRIVIPKLNEKDLEEIPSYIKKGITFIPVEAYPEVIKAVFR
ncbi:MAG: endopeptidase La [Spirochaetes bacterium]|nr:endopeptidase La [Spirochaetota bacterium]